MDIVEPLGQSIGDFGMQELDAASARSAVAVQPPGAPIEQHKWEVLGADHAAKPAGVG